MKKLLIALLTITSLNSFADTAINCKNNILSFSLNDNQSSHTLSYQLTEYKSTKFIKFLEKSFSDQVVTKITGGSISRNYTSPGRYTSNWRATNESSILAESLIFNLENQEGNISFTNSSKAIIATLPMNAIPVAHYELEVDNSVDPETLKLTISYYKDLKVQTYFDISSQCKMMRRPNTTNN